MILVTGGCGYIGSHCALHLIQQGYEVIIVDNLINSDKSSIEILNQITKKRPIFIESDIRDYGRLKNIFSNYDIDTVFHFAGLKSVVESIGDPQRYFSFNVEGTLSLINAIINSSVKRMVFSSSATVYGNEFNPPWNESINIQMPNQPYAQTKFISENILKFFSNNYREISIGILRYFNPIGCHGSGLMGENMKNSTNLVPQIMKTLSGESKFLNIYGNNYNTSDGTGIRDYIHINDLIIGHIKALEFISRKKGFNTWNLGSGKGYSVLEVIRTFENLSGKKIPYRFVSKRDGDIAEYWADISKAKNELDWSCKNGLDDMIKDTLNYINHTANN